MTASRTKNGDQGLQEKVQRKKMDKRFTRGDLYGVWCGMPDKHSSITPPLQGLTSSQFTDQLNTFYAISEENDSVQLSAISAEAGQLPPVYFSLTIYEEEV